MAPARSGRVSTPADPALSPRGRASSRSADPGPSRPRRVRPAAFYPIDDTAMMVLEARPPLDLGRLAGLGTALADAWTARRANPAALAGTWLSRIRRCVLRSPSAPTPIWHVRRVWWCRCAGTSYSNGRIGGATRSGTG